MKNIRIAFLIITLLLLSVSYSCKQAAQGEFTVKSGQFRKSIIETGELVSVNSFLLTMPRFNLNTWEYKIVGLVGHGKLVQKGDSVIALDPSAVQKTILEKEENLENEQAAANKQKVTMENNIQDLEAQFKNETANYNLKKLELDRIQFESDSKKRIKELEFQQATTRLEKVKRNLELKPKLLNLDLKIQNIRVSQRKNEISEARKVLKKLTIYSPTDGIFQVESKDWWSGTGQLLRIGDKVYMGSKIARIPDIFKMKVQTSINEADLKNVKLGMPVVVRLDALPAVPFNGKVSYISRICTDRDKQKVFKAEVEIIESDLRLKPGMTVSCEYVCYETDKAMYVPNSCLLKEQGHSFVYSPKGKTPKKIEVISGISNNNHTIITGEVKPGQQLVPIDNIKKDIGI